MRFEAKLHPLKRRAHVVSRFRNIAETLACSAKSYVTHFHTEVQHFTGFFSVRIARIGFGPANHGPPDTTGQALLVQVSLQGTLR
ncbi:hypothetical protein MHYP_G00275580 [Metynnis hypsauchen]